MNRLLDVMLARVAHQVALLSLLPQTKLIVLFIYVYGNVCVCVFVCQCIFLFVFVCWNTLGSYVGMLDGSSILARCPTLGLQKYGRVFLGADRPVHVERTSRTPRFRFKPLQAVLKPFFFLSFLS